MSNLSKKSVRLSDIARAAGCSGVAVGNVLLGSGGANVRVSQKTREKVLRVAEEMNYAPNRFAQHLAGKRTRLIGSIIDTFAHERFHDMLSETEQIFRSKGYRFMVGQTHGELNLIEEHIRDFSSYGVDGIICFSHEYPGKEEKIVDLFKNQQNVLFFSRPLPDPVKSSSISHVASDVVMSSRISVEHLLERGRKRIALFILSSGSWYMRERLEGYRQGLLQAGLEFDEDLVIKLPAPVRAGQYDQQALKNEVLSVVRDKRVDGLVMGDNAAILALGILHQNNIRVPDEVAVVGSDNIYLSGGVTPALTTVDFQGKAMAENAAEILLEMIHSDEKQPKHRIVSPKLIIREST